MGRRTGRLKRPISGWSSITSSISAIRSRSALACNATTVQFHNDGETGTKRTLDVEDFIFDYQLALATGTYFTNPYGTARVASDSEHAVEQYIAPGFYLDLAAMGDGRCVAVDPWTMRYLCDADISVGKVNISHSLDPAAWDAQLLSAAQDAGLTLAEATLQYRCTIETTLDRSEAVPVSLENHGFETMLAIIVLAPSTLHALALPERTVRVRSDEDSASSG